jgi:hypothetical protein
MSKPDFKVGDYLVSTFTNHDVVFRLEKEPYQESDPFFPDLVLWFIETPNGKTSIVNVYRKATYEDVLARAKWLETQVQECVNEMKELAKIKL